MLLSSSTKQPWAFFVCLLALQGANHVWQEQRKLKVVASDTQQQPLTSTQSSSSVSSSNSNSNSTNNSSSNNNNNNNKNKLLVEYGDSIYLQGDWDASPIVVEEFKLIFFTTAKVACTSWKQLFRRMMHYPNWNVEEYNQMLPWNPYTNGLKYLYDFDRVTASQMLQDPSFVKAIFVRDPKERFLSAYLDKAVAHKSYMREKCCWYRGDCAKVAKDSPEGFLSVIRFCDDAHWRPQHARMEAKYWNYITFVGRFENLFVDARALLTRIGAWELYGQSGWGTNGNLSMFQSSHDRSGRHHATSAHSKLKTYLTPQLAKQVDEFYQYDYDNPVLNFTAIQLYQ